jgi:hypothetical protein
MGHRHADLGLKKWVVDHLGCLLLVLFVARLLPMIQSRLL